MPILFASVVELEQWVIRKALIITRGKAMKAAAHLFVKR
jgi:hypothetical protein